MIIEHGNEVEIPQYNTIEGDIDLVNSRIVFKGEGNRLVADGKVRISDSVISFNGDNALLFLSEHIRHPYKIKLDLWRETTTFFGKNSYFNGALSAIISERKNLIVGGEGVFSFGIWIRTADPHLIYDIEGHNRINPSRSILIGDHVWIGQSATILKGSSIGSGSIISANAVVAGKKVGSNTIWGGNPARRLKKGVFFSGESVHNYTEEDTKAHATHKSSKYIYRAKGETLSIETIDEQLAIAGKNPEDREECLRSMLVLPDEKNRFFIKDNEKKRFFFR